MRLLLNTLFLAVCVCAGYTDSTDAVRDFAMKMLNKQDIEDSKWKVPGLYKSKAQPLINTSKRNVNKNSAAPLSPKNLKEIQNNLIYDITELIFPNPDYMKIMGNPTYEELQNVITEIVRKPSQKVIRELIIQKKVDIKEFFEKNIKPLWTEAKVTELTNFLKRLNEAENNGTLNFEDVEELESRKEHIATVLSKVKLSENSIKILETATHLPPRITNPPSNPVISRKSLHQTEEDEKNTKDENYEMDDVDIKEEQEENDDEAPSNILQKTTSTPTIATGIKVSTLSTSDSENPTTNPNVSKLPKLPNNGTNDKASF